MFKVTDKYLALANGNQFLSVNTLFHHAANLKLYMSAAVSQHGQCLGFNVAAP